MPFTPSNFNVEIPTSRCSTHIRNTLNSSEVTAQSDAYRAESKLATTTPERRAELAKLIAELKIVRVDVNTPFTVASFANECITQLVNETIAVRNAHNEASAKAAAHDARVAEAVTGRAVSTATPAARPRVNNPALTVDEAREAIRNSTNAHVRFLSAMPTFSNFSVAPRAKPQPPAEPRVKTPRVADPEAQSVYDTELNRLISAGVSEQFAKASAKTARSNYLRLKHAAPGDRVYAQKLADVLATGVDQATAEVQAAAARKEFHIKNREARAVLRATSRTQAVASGVERKPRKAPNTTSLHTYVSKIMAVAYTRHATSFVNGSNYVQFLDLLAQEVVHSTVSMAKAQIKKGKTLSNALYNVTLQTILQSYGATPETVTAYNAMVEANRALRTSTVKDQKVVRASAAAKRFNEKSQEERDLVTAKKAAKAAERAANAVVRTQQKELLARQLAEARVARAAKALAEATEANNKYVLAPATVTA
jgi:hypothetical protein